VLFLFIFILLFVPQAPTHAAWDATIPTDDGLSVNVRSPFDTIPPAGYLPVDVTISSDSDTAHTYDIRASTSLGYGGNQTTAATTATVTVPPTQRVTVPLLVPIVPESAAQGRNRQGAVTVTGPGVRANGPANFPNNPQSGTPFTAFTALSADLALRSWGPLEEQAKKDSRPLVGTQFNPADLPASWLGLSGLANLWITAAELDTLSPAQRAAVDDWIRQGGHLFWVLDETSARTVAEFADPGLGTITPRRWNGTELPTIETLAALKAGPNSTHQLLAERYTTNWKLADLVGRLQFPVTLLILFITIFAVTVGPINLFVLAGPGRRQRLFWTTPLISLVASLLLGAIIWLQDGSGGDGQRVVLGVLTGDTNQLLLRQEQVSRSGLLLDRAFTLTEDALVAPISLTGDASLETARRFEQTGKNLSGQWFNSRAVQAQYLEAIVPTRARIELTDTAEDGTPTLLSSVPFTLERILYTDDTGTQWQGGPLRTGEKITLTQSTPDATRAIYGKSKSAGPLISEPWEKFWTNKNTFLATATEGPYLETLPTIRWTNHQSLLTGPVDTNAVSNRR
jgi:hypothetical protein